MGTLANVLLPFGRRSPNHRSNGPSLPPPDLRYETQTRRNHTKRPASSSPYGGKCRTDSWPNAYKCGVPRSTPKPSRQYGFPLDPHVAGLRQARPPPNSVKPIPITTIRHGINVANASNDPSLQVTVGMFVLAFFFLLRPGEYASASSDSTPFTTGEVQFFIGAL